MSSKTPEKTDKPAELESGKTPPVTEALADDVAAESVTFEPGTPELLPHLQMPRVRRAKAYGALGAVQAQNEKVNPKDSGGTDDADGDADAAVSSEGIELDPTEYGDRYLVLGLIEEYLAICARDEDAFRRWALEVDDRMLIKTFNTYMKVNQPGEATSSAS